MNFQKCIKTLLLKTKLSWKTVQKLILVTIFNILLRSPKDFDGICPLLFFRLKHTDISKLWNMQSIRW